MRGVSRTDVEVEVEEGVSVAGSSERRKWRGTRKTPLLNWIYTTHLYLSLY